MAVCRFVRSDSLDVRTASEILIRYSTVTKEVLKATSDGLIDLATCLQKIPRTDQDKDDVSEEDRTSALVIKSVEDTYGCAHSFIMKCYRLAGYIIHEEERTIAAIKRGKVDKFKSFVNILLVRSTSCQQELSFLISHIEKQEKPLLDHYQAIVEAKATSAKKKAVGSTAGIVGGGGAIATGLSAAGAATVVTFATSIGPQAPLTIPIGLTVAIGSFLFAAAGGTAIGAAVGSGAVILHYKKKKKAYEDLIATLKDMKECLQRIESDLINVREQLVLSIDNHLQCLTNKTFKRIEQRTSLPNTIETVALQSRQLKEYCQPIVNAPTLKEFSKSGHTKQS